MLLFAASLSSEKELRFTRAEPNKIFVRFDQDLATSGNA